MTFYRVTVKDPLSYNVRYVRHFKTESDARAYENFINDDYYGYYKPYIVKDPIEVIEISEKMTYKP